MTARILLAASLVLITATGCRNGDARADTTATANPVLVGPENIVVIRAQEIRTGPTLSGAIQAEREATVRAEIPASVMETYAEPGQRAGL